MQRYMILYQSCQKRQWKSEKWGISSAGRALHWQCRGQRFDPAMLHQHSVGESLTFPLFLFLLQKPII